MSKYLFLWESYCMLTMKNIFVPVSAGLQFYLYVEKSDKEWDVLFWEIYRGG